jgi:glycosyltransferase involved in cell wall biosynthesis
MRIAVDATRLLREVRGLGRYVRALLPRFVEQRTDISLLLFSKPGDVGKLHDWVAADPQLGGRVEVQSIRGIEKARADVFWYPWNIALPAPASGAVVATIHDVANLALPDPRWTAWAKNRRWRRRYEATARRATMIVADSEFTESEVHRMLGVPHERMRVVLLAADDGPVPPADGDAAALERLGVHPPFLLTVGAAERRKNYAMLERAVQQVVSTGSRITLVQAGPRRHSNQRSEPPWLRTLGFVSESDLVALYRATTALIMPSNYEGFGLPVLEAMRLGAPVICARASSLPEVGGDAAAWIDPDDDVRLAEMITRLMTEPSLRASMRAASVAHEARFSWDSTARQTLSVFDEAARLA